MMKTIKAEKYQATRTARVTNTGCRIQFEYLQILDKIIAELVLIIESYLHNTDAEIINAKIMSNINME